MDGPLQDGRVNNPVSDFTSTSDLLSNNRNKINRRKSSTSLPLSELRRQSSKNPSSYSPENGLPDGLSTGCQFTPYKGSQTGDPYGVEYSRAVNMLGVGKFHIGLALCCGFTFLATGLQNNLNAYILPSVHCDLHISSSQMGLFNAVFLAGGISSNFLWGMIADMMGRKTVVVYGMFADGFLTLCSSLSQHYEVLLVFRFLNGFVVGGPASLVLAYMGEFFPDRLRSTVICYVGIFWTLSWVFMPGLAWIVIPLQWSLVWSGFVFNSWRLLVALTAIPSLLSATLLLLFPESPRFVLVQGHNLQAVSILSRIYASNNNTSPEYYPVKSLHENNGPSTSDTDPKSVCRPISVLLHQTQQLFTARTIRITALACFLFFSNMFGYYGLGLWLPELFNRMSSHLELAPGTPVTLCTAGANVFVNTTSADSICDPTNVDTSVFIKSVIMGVVGLTGNVISGVLAGRLSRSTLPVTLMGLSSICVVIIHFTTNMTLNVVLASAFQLTVGTANLVFNALVVDMFPPNISGMGVCVAILSGRLGGMISNLVFGQLLDISCSIPIFLVAAILFAGSVVSFLIPKEPYTERRTSVALKATKQETCLAVIS